MIRSWTEASELPGKTTATLTCSPRAPLPLYKQDQRVSIFSEPLLSRFRACHFTKILLSKPKDNPNSNAFKDIFINFKCARFSKQDLLLY